MLSAHEADIITRQDARRFEVRGPVSGNPRTEIDRSASGSSGRPTHTDPVLVCQIVAVDLADLAPRAGREIGPPAGACRKAPDGELALALDALRGRPGLADIHAGARRGGRAAEARVEAGPGAREDRGVCPALSAAAAVGAGLDAVGIERAATRLGHRARARQAARGVDRVTGSAGLRALHLDAREHALSEIAGGAHVVGARVATRTGDAGARAMRRIVDVDRERSALAARRRSGRAIRVAEAPLRGLAGSGRLVAILAVGACDLGVPRGARRDQADEEEEDDVTHGTPGEEHDSCRSVTRRDPVVRPQFSMPAARTIRPTA